MYLQFFGLAEKPFAITPDPRYLYLSGRHADALAHLVYGINEAGGFIQLTGEVGTGKTTTIRSLLARAPKSAEIALILNPRLSATEFLRSLCEELGLGADDHGDSDNKNLVDLLNRYLPDGSKLHKPAVAPANVLVVGATNRKDDLDPALIRPGRFDRSIYFGLPGRRARGDIIAYYLGKKAHAADLDEHGAVDIVAGMTFGYSPAALERLMDEALVIALTHGRSAMTMSDVAEAKMLVELGVTDETIYTPNERDRVATHEAGHATVAYFVGQTRQLDVLSIVKRRDSLGLLQHSDTEERFTKSSEELRALLQIAMGGMVAEEHWFDEVSTGPASDLAAATSIGAQMIGACGMGTSLISVAAAGNGFLEGGLVDKVLGDATARAELDTLLMASCDAAKAIVTAHPEVVEALRDALLERDELVGSEITEVVESVLSAPKPAEIAELRPSSSTGGLA